MGDDAYCAFRDEEILSVHDTPREALIHMARAALLLAFSNIPEDAYFQLATLLHKLVATEDTGKTVKVGDATFYVEQKTEKELVELYNENFSRR